MGALFIHVSLVIGPYRKKFVNSNVKKVLECCIFAFLTSSCFYGVVSWRGNNCRPSEATIAENSEEEFKFTCNNGFYNPLATLIFNTEGGTIRQFFKYPGLI